MVHFFMHKIVHFFLIQKSQLKGYFLQRNTYATYQQSRLFYFIQIFIFYLKVLTEYVGYSVSKVYPNFSAKFADALFAASQLG